MHGSNRGEGIKALTGQKADAPETGQKAAARDKQGSEPEQAVALSIKQPPANPEATVANQQAQTEQPSKYDLRDLHAQEDMAFWAMWMFLAALATFAVTSFGTLLIWRQVKLTREAVEDTGKATKAMERQNEISEQAQRPWVTPDLPAIFHLHETTVSGKLIHNGLGFGPRWQNTGQRPAVDVRVFSSLTEINPEDTDLPQPAASNEDGAVALPVGAFLTLGSRMLDDRETARFRSQSVRYLLHSRVEYSDPTIPIQRVSEGNWVVVHQGGTMVDNNGETREAIQFLPVSGRFTLT